MAAKRPRGLFDGSNAKDSVVFGDLARQVPRRSSTTPAEEADRADIALGSNNIADQDYFNASYPMLVRSVNRNLGTSYEPTFLTPLADLAANMPAELVGDPQTAATLPLGMLAPALASTIGRTPRAVLKGLTAAGAGGAALGGAKGAGRYMYELAKDSAKETLYEGPMSAAEYARDMDKSEGGLLANLLKVQKSAPSVQDREGNTIPANSPDYPYYYGKSREQYENNLGDINQYATEEAKRKLPLPYNPYSGKLPPSMKGTTVQPWGLSPMNRR